MSTLNQTAAMKTATPTHATNTFVPGQNAII